MYVIDSYRQTELTPPDMRKAIPASSTALLASSGDASREK